MGLAGLRFSQRNFKKNLDPGFASCLSQGFRQAGIAQLVERDLAKVEATSSSLVARSILRTSPPGEVFLFPRNGPGRDTGATVHEWHGIKRIVGIGLAWSAASSVSCTAPRAPVQTIPPGLGFALPSACCAFRCRLGSCRPVGTKSSEHQDSCGMTGPAAEGRAGSPHSQEIRSQDNWVRPIPSLFPPRPTGSVPANPCQRRSPTGSVPVIPHSPPALDWHPPKHRDSSRQDRSGR